MGCGIVVAAVLPVLCRFKRGQRVLNEGVGHGFGLACRCGACHAISALDVKGLASLAVS